MVLEQSSQVNVGEGVGFLRNPNISEKLKVIKNKLNLFSKTNMRLFRECLRYLNVLLDIWQDVISHSLPQKGLLSNLTNQIDSFRVRHVSTVRLSVVSTCLNLLLAYFK